MSDKTETGEGGRIARGGTWGIRDRPPCRANVQQRTRAGPISTWTYERQQRRGRQEVPRTAASAPRSWRRRGQPKAKWGHELANKNGSTPARLEAARSERLEGRDGGGDGGGRLWGRRAEPLGGPVDVGRRLALDGGACGSGGDGGEGWGTGLGAWGSEDAACGGVGEGGSRGLGRVGVGVVRGREGARLMPPSAAGQGRRSQKAAPAKRRRGAPARAPRPGRAARGARGSLRRRR